jgi:hypothetical protein
VLMWQGQSISVSSPTVREGPNRGEAPAYARASDNWQSPQNKCLYLMGQLAP